MEKKEERLRDEKNQEAAAREMVNNALFILGKYNVDPNESIPVIGTAFEHIIVKLAIMRRTNPIMELTACGFTIVSSASELADKMQALKESDDILKQAQDIMNGSAKGE